ncbi:thiosulfate sulfurtransferase 18-like isoform X3 [Phalaenopsis equestris]|uniref:thiosulfate sulfurtransferase 18-like isoform X3 n=1 Tax=Phalaenopsis equestris TaxID=78828 RepID=UPI0009E3BFDA|nr:thiosulfate sulfurtransferase 18-like isoform X3 [Phalaenopsis equestris]
MDPNPSACSSDQAVVTIDVHSTKTLLNSGHRYLDVRTAEEFENGHLEKSLNVPYMFLTPQGRVKNQKFLEEVIRLCNRDDFIVVGCQSGVRSLKAAEDLLVAGFKNVKNMGGGYAAWSDNGFEVKKTVDELR